MDDAEKRTASGALHAVVQAGLEKRGVKLEKERMKREGVHGGGRGSREKQRGKSMTGNLGICRTEIGSHLDRLSKRKADFTADGSAVAGL